MSREKPRVLIVDDDPATEAALRGPLEDAGWRVDVTPDTMIAIEKLAAERYRAVIVDPMIRHRLNGYAILGYLELEQPQMMGRVFLSTALPKQTIARTAPALLSRLFRKGAETEELLAAVTAPAEAQPKPKRRARQKSVLVVEDDAVTARLTCRLLDEIGYASEWVASGASALETVATAKHDVILLDLVLPDLDGFALLQHLEARDPELLRRVVVTTGMPPQYLDDIHRQPLCGILHKPVQVAALRRVLDRCGEVPVAEAGGEYPAMEERRRPAG